MLPWWKGPAGKILRAASSQNGTFIFNKPKGTDYQKIDHLRRGPFPNQSFIWDPSSSEYFAYSLIKDLEAKDLAKLYRFCAPVQLFYRTTTGQWVHVFNVKLPLRKHTNPPLTLHSFNEKKRLLKSVLIICTLVQYFSGTSLLARRTIRKWCRSSLHVTSNSSNKPRSSVRVGKPPELRKSGKGLGKEGPQDSGRQRGQEEMGHTGWLCPSFLSGRRSAHTRHSGSVQV